MRTFRLPNLFSGSLMAGSLVLLGALATGAAETGSSSVNFVDRGALKSNGWTQSQGNQLRRNTIAAGQPLDANSLREADAAAAPSAENVNANSSQRNASGLQLRPHTPETGIFSSWFGQTPKPKAQPKQQPQPQPRTAKAQSQSPSQYQPMPPKAAAAQAMGMMPQFMSSSGKKQAASTALAPSATMRAGSAQQRVAQRPQQNGAVRATTQASYDTAAAAQSHRSQGAANMPGSIPVQRQAARGMSDPRLTSIPSPTSQPGPISKSRLVTTKNTNHAAGMSSTAALLADAHQLAERAKSEAEFTKIFEVCQQIPASKATGEETAFGRQLAAWSLNRRGQLRARAGHTEDAMDDFNLAIRIDSTCWRALHNRGVLVAQAGEFEQAFDDFHRTIELNPSFAKAFSNRAALYVLAGELEPALSDYQRAIELDSQFAIAQRGCGRVCHLLGRTDESLEHLTRAIELSPKDSAALASRGDLLTDLGQYPAAARDYERALALNSKNIDACRGSAWLLATCPQESVCNPDLALRRAQMAMQLDRQADVVTLDTLAAAQASTGDFEAAMQTIRRAIDLASPSERSVYQDRMQMYQRSTPYRIAPLSEVQQVAYEQ